MTDDALKLIGKPAYPSTPGSLAGKAPSALASARLMEKAVWPFSEVAAGNAA